MKSGYFVCFCLCLNFTFSQDTIEPIDGIRHIGKSEIAYSFLTVNTNHNLLLNERGTATSEILNGILLRRSLNNKFSIRAGASFFRKEIDKDWIENGTNYEYGNIQTNDYKFGFGLQDSITRKRDNIYFFLDEKFRHRKEAGNIVAVLDSDYDCKLFIN